MDSFIDFLTLGLSFAFICWRFFVMQICPCYLRCSQNYKCFSKMCHAKSVFYYSRFFKSNLKRLPICPTYILWQSRKFTWYHQSNIFVFSCPIVDSIFSIVLVDLKVIDSLDSLNNFVINCICFPKCLDVDLSFFFLVTFLLPWF